MQGQWQQQAREDATLSFKRFILQRSEAFASEPKADLYRVNLLAQMLDRYDELRGAGVGEEMSIQRVEREFADIHERMADAGFERADRFAPRGDSRWPQLSEMDVERFLKEEGVYAHKNAIGSALCAACCAPLFAAMSVSGLWYYSWRVEEAMSFIGLGGLFAMIGLGVYTFATAQKPKLHSDVKRGRFSLSNRMRRRIEELYEAVNVKTRKRVARGIAMFVTCVVPLFIGVAFGNIFGGEDFFAMLGLTGMFGMIGLGTYELVVANGEKKTVKQLLKQKK